MRVAVLRIAVRAVSVGCAARRIELFDGCIVLVVRRIRLLKGCVVLVVKIGLLDGC